MNFERWEPIYLQILEDFSFSRKGDEESALLLQELLRGRLVSLEVLESLIRDQRVLVCGNAPSLHEELLDMLSSRPETLTIVAADGATSVLLGEGMLPAVIVSDLDGNVEDIVRASQAGSVVVVHAHGDNMDKIGEQVPRLVRVVGTTQSRPIEVVHNFGGFTDGDRCVFLARHFGAAEVRLVGFDFDDPTVTPRKRKKLQWARVLIDLASREGAQDC